MMLGSRSHRALGSLLPLFLVAALGACTPAPLPRGIYCLRAEEPALVGFQLVNQTQDLSGTREEWKGYRSTDGGLTWAAATDLDTKAAESRGCRDTLPYAGSFRGTWVYSEEANPRLRYLFLVNEGIYRSDDQGASYRRDSAWRGYVQSAALHRATGNLILATGQAKVLVRTADGNWREVQVVGP